MATSKSSKTDKTTTPQKKNSFAENYGSTILGFIVVLILGSFLFNVFRGNNQNGKVGSGEETQNEEGQQANGRTHVVAPGEDLWKISVKYYNTGYNWTDIAKANNITDANQIEEGQQLVIPEVTPVGPTEIAQAPEATVAPSATSAPTEIVATEAPKATAAVTVAPTVTTTPQQAPTSTSGSYTVQKGDSLWSIAVAQYNDGYKWVEIARANKLVNPDFIHVGNTLTLPR